MVYFHRHSYQIVVFFSAIQIFCLFSIVHSQDNEDVAMVPCKIPSIRNGFVKLSRGGTVLATGATVQSGTFVQVACGSGFALSEDGGRTNSIVCLEDGQFTAEFKRCEAVRPSLSQCGVTSAIAVRVWGGGFAAAGQFPWMAKLEIAIIGQRKPNICGASLIAKNWLLTAAHCLANGGEVVVVTAFLGRTNFSSESEAADEQRIFTREFYIHPNYKGRSDGYQYDFALIKLNPAPILGDMVKPICLPDEKAFCDTTTTRNMSKVDGCTEVIAAGWGMTENGTQVSPSLKMINLTVSSRSSCERLGGYDNITAAQFCAGRSVEAQDTCSGDSGGPLMCQRADVPLRVVVGVVSYGRACGEADIPGVYGRVCKALPWIKFVVNGTATGDASQNGFFTNDLFSSEVSSGCLIPPLENGYFTKANNLTGLDTQELIGAAGLKMTLGQTLYLHCEGGFSIPNQNGSIETSKKLVCSQPTRWSPDIDSTLCSQVVTCSPSSLPRIQNGSFANKSGNFGESRRMQCNPGFRLPPDVAQETVVTTCQANGLWSQLSQSVYCYQIGCGKVPTVSNGTIGGGFSMAGSIRNVTCWAGYQLAFGSASSITCQASGNWTLPGRCVPVVLTCSNSTLPKLTNGAYTEPAGSLAYQVGNTVQLECKSGYKLASGDASLTVQCLPSGTWSLLSSFCKPFICSTSALATILPENSRYGDDYESETTKFGVDSTLQILCNAGYRFSSRVSSISVTCQLNGRWSPITDFCQMANCSFASLPDIMNGNWQYTGETVDYSVGSSVSFSCNFGYLKSGSSFSVSCQKDGLWSSLSGQCIRKIVNLPCSQNYMFKCSNGSNISCWYLCDRSNNCGDSSDESICNNTMEYQHWLDGNLYLAAANGSLELVRSLLGKGANMETKETYGYTSLTAAATNGRLEVVRLLLDRGANINALTNYGQTPLYWAAYSNQLNVVTLLVDRGADMNVVSDATNVWNACRSSTALMCAAERNLPSIAEYLRSKGASRQRCTFALCN